MFRLKQMAIDTLGEHVVFIHESTVHAGNLGFNPLDRVHVVGRDQDGLEREVIGVLNFCRDSIVAADEIGLSDDAFRDFGLAAGSPVNASLSPAPRSVDLVRQKLNGHRLSQADFCEILRDVVARRYSKVELSMFVLACALRTLDREEMVSLTRAMIDTGHSIDFGVGPIADKHCIGGVPGNRTTMIVVPILVALGVKIPKTSSRAITSPAGTADTMALLAEVDLDVDELRRVVSTVGGCIAWGGAVHLAPADDMLITVERPMEIDTEVQMVASILSKKKTAGATHALIDIPVGATTKVRSMVDAERLGELFRIVAGSIGLSLDIVVTEARGPIGRGIGPRLEALDVLAVLQRHPDAPADLREKSLYLASRTLEMVGGASAGGGYGKVLAALDSGAAAEAFERIRDAQGRRELPPPAPFCATIASLHDGRISAIDCLEIARVAKRAGAPAHPASGVRLLRVVGDIVRKGDPLFEVHAQSEGLLRDSCAYAETHPEITRYGF
jgi:thymidine phosphorylase